MRNRKYTIVHNDAGIVLVVGLLTLVLLTALGISMTTTSTVESSIAGNEKTHKEALYAAELGLAVGENTVSGFQSRIDLHEATVAGHYAKDEEPSWQELVWDNTDSREVVTLPTGLKYVAATPRYTIEEQRFKADSLAIGIGMTTGTYLFNVRGRGTGGNKEAHVFLETIYARRFN